VSPPEAKLQEDDVSLAKAEPNRVSSQIEKHIVFSPKYVSAEVDAPDCIPSIVVRPERVLRRHHHVFGYASLVLNFCFCSCDPSERSQAGEISKNRVPSNYSSNIVHNPKVEILVEGSKNLFLKKKGMFNKKTDIGMDNDKESTSTCVAAPRKESVFLRKKSVLNKKTANGMDYDNEYTPPCVAAPRTERVFLKKKIAVPSKQHVAGEDTSYKFNKEMAIGMDYDEESPSNCIAAPRKKSVFIKKKRGAQQSARGR
jgi:hypothetical protein